MRHKGKQGKKVQRTKWHFLKQYSVYSVHVVVCSLWKQHSFVRCVCSFSALCQGIDHYAETRLFAQKYDGLIMANMWLT
jgi:hypothetical protein